MHHRYHYFSQVCCCIKGGACGEESCPCFCLCLEAHICNGAAVSASRALVMDQYDLVADPCDNQLMRFSNCLQYMSCVCHTLAVIDNSFDDLARIIDFIAELVYHTVSGCMTSQVATEVNYQLAQPPSPSGLAPEGQFIDRDGNMNAYPHKEGSKGGNNNNYGNGNYNSQNNYRDYGGQYQNDNNNGSIPVAYATPMGGPDGQYSKSDLS